METTVKKAFEKFNQFKILIVGDVMIDAYMWGNVTRISPEAPVPIINIKKTENRMGGAANVALNVSQLGAKPIICSIIGDDQKGNEFKELLKKSQMSNEGMLVSKMRKTTVKTRVISGGQQLLRIDEELTPPLENNLEEDFIKHIEKLIDKNTFDAIIFEDYDKGTITPPIIDFVVKKAKEKNTPTLVDPKKRNFCAYKGVTLFKPNFKEICEGLKQEIKKNDFEALYKAANQLKQKLDIQYIMVTLSELGIFVAEKETYYRIPAHIRDIADVSGAGDTVISVAACCLAAQMDMKLLAKITNLAGGLVCEKVGVVPIDKEQLMTEILKQK